MWRGRSESVRMRMTMLANASFCIDLFVPHVLCHTLAATWNLPTGISKTLFDPHVTTSSGSRTWMDATLGVLARFASHPTCTMAFPADLPRSGPAYHKHANKKQKSLLCKIFLPLPPKRCERRMCTWQRRNIVILASSCSQCQATRRSGKQNTRAKTTLFIILFWNLLGSNQTNHPVIILSE